MLYLANQALAGFSCDVDVGASSDSYVAAAATDLVAALAAFVAWLSAGGRPWAGAVWTATWQRDPSTGAARVLLQCDAEFALTVVGAANPLGLVGAHVQAYSMTGTAAQGTWWPVSDVGIRDHLQHVGDGDACGNGAVRPGIPGTAIYRPKVGAVGTAVDAGRLSSVLADATSPRQVAIWHHAAGLWRTYALGDVRRNRVGATHYRFELACAGAA